MYIRERIYIYIGYSRRALLRINTHGSLQSRSLIFCYYYIVYDVGALLLYIILLRIHVYTIHC